MNLHANAALSLKGRRQLAVSVVSGERKLTEAAEAAGVSLRCARRWSSRYREEGEAGLRDRSAAPKRIPNKTSPERVQVICDLRRLRFSGPEIAELLSMALSTVSAVLNREGVGRLGRLGLEPAVRYEHDRPGALIHIDIKKLADGSTAAPGTGSWGIPVNAQLPAGSPILRESVVSKSATNTFTSRSTITAAWPTPRCSRMRRPAQRSGFSAAPGRSMSATASPSSGY